ncbi:two-component system chemotaxis response regulator CheY [Chitinophaga niastensis]|uniref:Two-component system chemotaxis response regulator CheY n=1 Tax=Chitinophaga niastensis TaxID=536980 RepID=A0A2P8HBZ0_CHINA|nr:response regulator [Chitinophaga niastensis]PSL43743.1 two-component system chemotaxis response regulator CheY [Chitinophaga niastensis]
MKKNVLVIDDSLPIRYLLEAVLSRKHKVTSAGDGLSAMAWLTKGNVPDLIITDLQMPNIDGWELIDYLSTSNLYQQIPVIVLSGIINSKETFQNKHYDNVRGILTKPFDPVMLLDKVDGIFDNRFMYVFS